MKFIDLGLIDYDAACRIQLDAVNKVIRGGEERIFLLEHYPVITLGRNHSKDNLLTSERLLYSMGIHLGASSRGGDITCHFPGQLVIYPVVRIMKKPGGIRAYFFSLEQIIINLLSRYRIESSRSGNGPGVYIRKGKIASMGIAVKKWVAYHGVALNLCKDLGVFEHINPCGHKRLKMTSIHQETGSDHPDMNSLKKDFCREFLLIQQKEQKAFQVNPF